MKEAIILAGGLGTRLRSSVPDLPKCMAPVNGKPFLDYVLHYYAEQGIEKFIFSLGYKHEIIVDYLQTNFSHLKYQYVIEEEPLGTGGAIKLACTMATEKSVLVLNGDTFFKIDVAGLSVFHQFCGADCTLSLKPLKEIERYGLVELKKDYSILSFSEKSKYENGLINGGVYALNSEKFLKETLPEKFSFEKDYLEKLFLVRRMYGYIQDKYFIDIGIPEDFKTAQTELPTNI